MNFKLCLKCLFWPCSLTRLPISRVIGCRKTLQHVLQPPFNLNGLHQNKHFSHLLIYNFSKSRFQCDALTLGSTLLFRRSRKGSFCELEGLGTPGRLNICSDRQFQTILPFWSYSGNFPKIEFTWNSCDGEQKMQVYMSTNSHFRFWKYPY